MHSNFYRITLLSIWQSLLSCATLELQPSELLKLRTDEKNRNLLPGLSASVQSEDGYWMRGEGGLGCSDVWGCWNEDWGSLERLIGDCYVLGNTEETSRSSWSSEGVLAGTRDVSKALSDSEAEGGWRAMTGRNSHSNNVFPKSESRDWRPVRLMGDR